MAQPTTAELMAMIIRLDNKLNWQNERMGELSVALYSVYHKLAEKDKDKLNVECLCEAPPKRELFDRLPTPPKDFFSNKDEFTPAACNKHFSVWYCKNLCRICTQFQKFDKKGE